MTIGDFVVDVATFLQDMIVLILGTDMGRHNEIMEAFNQKLEYFDFNSKDHLTSLKTILIKACDISNECRPHQVKKVQKRTTN